MADQAAIADVRVVFERGDHLDSGGAACHEGGMEHRLGTRMPISLPVKLHQPGKTPVPGRMTNVSLSGAYVQTSADLKPLARIGIACERLSSEAAGASCVTAFVTRMAADGVALEWLEFAPAVIRHMMRREQPPAMRKITPSAVVARTCAATVNGSPGVSGSIAVL